MYLCIKLVGPDPRGHFISEFLQKIWIKFNLGDLKKLGKLSLPSEWNLYINEAKMFEMHVELNMPNLSLHFALYGQNFQQKFN